MMSSVYPLSAFLSEFSTEDRCLEEIKLLRYPSGIYCAPCRKITKHYKIKKRTAYSCKSCRHQVSPLAGTLFEKSTTPLQTWLFAIFLMTHIKGEISIKQLQRELGVTYKTAWRIYTELYKLMEQNEGDLLQSEEETKVHKWVFFNKIEIRVAQKNA